MGQAKLRGTKDERIEQACAVAAEQRRKAEIAKAESDEAERQRIAALPPEQQARIRKRTHDRHAAMAMWLGLGAGMLNTPRRR